MSECIKKIDKIENFHGALIQHGQLSNRIYLMKLKGADPTALISEMDKLAKANRYTKIFAKVPDRKAEVFLDNGYLQEAAIPGFFKGREEAIFLGKYFDAGRKKEKCLEEIENINELAKTTKTKASFEALPAGTILRQCEQDDAEEMSRIYQKVFKSYPFPIDQPEYIAKTMEENFVYFGVEIDGELVALSSAEMYEKNENVEMTDFATLPQFRGRGFAGRLLLYMGKKMRELEMKTGYTIARAISAGMNITFAKAGYDYAGRLVNNTNISGQIESMNIWYKKL